MGRGAARRVAVQVSAAAVVMTVLATACGDLPEGPDAAASAVEVEGSTLEADGGVSGAESDDSIPVPGAAAASTADAPDVTASTTLPSGSSSGPTSSTTTTTTAPTTTLAPSSSTTTTSTTTTTSASTTTAPAAVEACLSGRWVNTSVAVTATSGFAGGTGTTVDLAAGGAVVADFATMTPLEIESPPVIVTVTGTVAGTWRLSGPSMVTIEDIDTSQATVTVSLSGADMGFPLEQALLIADLTPNELLPDGAFVCGDSDLVVESARSRTEWSRAG